MRIIKDGTSFFDLEEAAKMSGFAVNTFQKYAKRAGLGVTLRRRLYSQADITAIKNKPDGRKTRWTKQKDGARHTK
jgi:hypothetical protein